MTGKSDRAVLEFIAERWAMLEPNAGSYGITLDDFMAERAHANVSPIDKKQRSAEGGRA